MQGDADLMEAKESNVTNRDVEADLKDASGWRLAEGSGVKLRNTFLTLLAGLSLLLSPNFDSDFVSPIFLVAALLQAAFSWTDWFGDHSRAVTRMVPALLFFAWNPRLLGGQVRTPKRTYVLVAIGVAVGVVDLIGSWSYGVRWQGLEYTLLVSAKSGACLAMLCILFFRSWKGEPSFVWNLALHWVFFAWLAWFAFPYLGEPI
jgi:hypothetical protein